MKLSALLPLSLVAAFAAADSTQRVSQTASGASAADSAVQSAHEMAATMSRRDVEGLLGFVPQTDSIVYVSNGFPIRGSEYRKVIGDFYASLESLDFSWEKWESLPLSDTTVLFTGWSHATMKYLDGRTEIERAIFTMVWFRESSGWKRVIAHKSIVSD